MRSFEFRFYDPADDEMVYSYEYHRLSDFFAAFERALKNGAKLTQYTGFKDIEGKKIFEGEMAENSALAGVVTYGRWLDSNSIAYVGFAICTTRGNYSGLDDTVKIINEEHNHNTG